MTDYTLPENGYPANFPEAIADLRGLYGRMHEDQKAMKGTIDRLSTTVEKLATNVDALTQRVDPVEAHVNDELREKRRAEWAVAQGWTPPAAQQPAVAAPTTSPGQLSPLAADDARPRMWESEDGRKVIKWTLGTVLLCALALAGGLTWTDIRGEVSAFLVGPSTTVEANRPERQLEDIHEPECPAPPPAWDTGDGPAAPRPVL